MQFFRKTARNPALQQTTAVRPADPVNGNISAALFAVNGETSWPQRTPVSRLNNDRAPRSRAIVALAALTVLCASPDLFAQSNLTAQDILTRMDKNETSTSAHSVGTITVEDKFGQKISGFESWTKGSDRSLIAFTSGEEKGQKVLRLKDAMYLAYPEADKPIKIQGAALRDSIAGSDLSYEDMAGDRSLLSRYNAALKGQEDVAGESCNILELRAKGAGLAYPLMKIWVSTKDFSARKIEKYSQNERLLKTEEITEVKSMNGKTLPVKFVMIDHLKGQSKTTFNMSSYEIDVAVDNNKFSLEELTW